MKEKYGEYETRVGEIFVLISKGMSKRLLERKMAKAPTHAR